jgi:hypothetical protein
VSDDALDLAFRTGLPFVGLRDHEHDPQLDTIVPPDAARSARAIPLAFADDHFRLAVADPEADLAALAPSLAGRRVELAIASREEVEAILGPAEEAAQRSTPAPSPGEATPAVAAPGDEALKEAAPTEAAPRDNAPKEPAPTEAAPRDNAPKEAAAEQPPDEDAADAQRHSLVADSEPQPLADQDSAEAAAEPHPGASESDAPAPASARPTGEPPSWLEPPRKRSRLRVLGLVLLVLLLLAVVGGAVAAYFVTR